MLALLAAAASAEAFAYVAGSGQMALRGVGAVRAGRCAVRPALSMQVQDEEKRKVKDVEEVTKKYGLEAGLFTAVT